MRGLLRSLSIAFAVLFAITPVTVRGQDATPAGEASATTEPLLRITDADLASSDLGVIGFVRTVFEPGAELALSAAEGPALLWIQSGNLSVLPGEGSAPLGVSAGGSGMAGSVLPLAAGEEAVLEAEQALILPAGATATIKNTGDIPAISLNLLPLTDVEAQPGAGVNQRLIARHDTPALSSPFAVELGRATIQPGKRHPVPVNAADFLLMSVDPSRLALLTGNYFNRGQSPMEVYVLTVTPMEDVVTTPTA